MSYISQYSPSQNSTYVKSTSKYSADYDAFYATDPIKSLTGSNFQCQWISQNLSYTNQRFHIDLGSAKIIQRIYYENGNWILGD